MTTPVTDEQRQQAIVQMQTFLATLLPQASEDQTMKGARELVAQAITFRNGGMPPAVDQDLLDPKTRELYQ